MWKFLIVLLAVVGFIAFRYVNPMGTSEADFEAQCKVLDDYLNHHGREDHENLNVQYYVRRSPVWVNIVPPNSPKNPKAYSKDQIEIIGKRVDERRYLKDQKPISQDTWKAFKSAQNMKFKWADCAFGPPLLTVESAADDASHTQKTATENNIKDEASWQDYKVDANDKNERYNFETFRYDYREPRPRDGRIFFYGVSRIGINDKENQAVFYLENTCQGTNCGTAVLVFMSKYSDTWKVRGMSMSGQFRHDVY